MPKPTRYTKSRSIGVVFQRLLLALMILLLPLHAAARDLVPAAKEPYQMGMSAAQSQDWVSAVHFFREAFVADPQATEIWFNLGLASAKLPGYEVRAIALFKVYLLANPDAPEAPALRAKIAILEAGYEAKLAKILNQLETLLLLHKKRATNIFLEESVWTIASGQYYLNNATAALRLINAAEGNDWQKNFVNILNGRVKDEYMVASDEKKMMPAMVSNGSIKYPMSLNDLSYDPDTFDFLLEQGNVTQAQKLLHGDAADGWAKLACLAYYNNDSALATNALVGAKAKMGDLLSSGACHKALWWSVGRTDFLLRIGTGGIQWRDQAPSHETELAEIVKDYNLEEDHFGHATSSLISVSLAVRTFVKEYRKVRGPAPATDEPAEAYAYIGNVYYNLGQYGRAVQIYDQAIQLNPNYAVAVASRNKALEKAMTQASPPPLESKSDTLGDEILHELMALEDYRDLQALYDQKKSDANWRSGDEGKFIQGLLFIARMDARSTNTGNKELEHTNGDHVVIEHGILSADIEKSKSYRRAVIPELAKKILSSEIAKWKMQDVLDRYRSLKFPNMYLFPAGAS